VKQNVFGGMVRYWLLKTEPTTYSFADLVKAGTTRWDGVTNALALKHLRSMTKGDRVLIYHSGTEKAVIGIAVVVRASYPDPRKHDPKIVVVDIQAKKNVVCSIPLAEIKARKEFASFALVRISRLSVMPVEQEIWNSLMELAGEVKTPKKMRAPKPPKIT